MKTQIYYSQKYQCKVVEKTISTLGDYIIPDPTNIPDLVELVQNKGISKILEYGNDYYIKPYVYGETVLDILTGSITNADIFNDVAKKYFDFMINFANIYDPYFCVDFGFPNVVINPQGLHLTDFDDFTICNRTNVLQTISYNLHKLEYICREHKINFNRNLYIDIQQLKFNGYNYAD